MVLLDKLQFRVLWGATSLLCSDAVSSFYGRFDAVTWAKIYFVVFGCMIQPGSPSRSIENASEEFPASVFRVEF
jgi:hypothetical protein